jgi:hypothetical protein
MPPAAVLSLQVQMAIEDAFTKLKQSVSDNDARDFNNTTLGDVIAVARTIETQLAARGSLRNAARLRPFLNGLEHYSKAVEVLCNGTPFLPWIWVCNLSLLVSFVLGLISKI